LSLRAGDEATAVSSEDAVDDVLEWVGESSIMLTDGEETTTALIGLRFVVVRGVMRVRSWSRYNDDEKMLF